MKIELTVDEFRELFNIISVSVPTSTPTSTPNINEWWKYTPQYSTDGIINATYKVDTTSHISSDDINPNFKKGQK